MIKLIRKLKILFLLKNAELYHKFWQEFKLKMLKFLKMTYVIADNAHIIEFINAIKIIINKQKQQTATLMKINMYTAALQFRTAVIIIKSLSVHEISMYFIRKIIIKCFNIILKNHVWSITQLIKKLTKKIKKYSKMLIIRKLFSKDIIITINIKK